MKQLLINIIDQIWTNIALRTLKNEHIHLDLERRKCVYVDVDKDEEVRINYIRGRSEGL